MLTTRDSVTRRRHGRHRRPSRRRGPRILLGILVTTVGSSLLGGSAPGAASADPVTAAPVCRDIDVPIISGPLAASMHASLCTPSGGDNGAIQILVAGGTYNHLYWTNLGTDARDSYVDRATAAGYSTLAIDRIGTGGSSHPASPLVTGSVQADAVHEVITRARTGRLAGHRYRQVALVGHSLGSMISVMVAGRRDAGVDAVVLTGYSHTIDPGQTAASLAAMHPAADEGRALDPGYLTTRFGLRPSLFHAAGDADPVITGSEESAKDVGSISELADAATAGTAAVTSRAITAPVLEANGGRDSWACAAVDCSSAAAFRAAEQPFYSRSLSTYLQPAAGHAVTLAADRASVLTAITSWIDVALRHRCAHPATATAPNVTAGGQGGS